MEVYQRTVKNLRPLKLKYEDQMIGRLCKIVS